MTQGKVSETFLKRLDESFLAPDGLRCCTHARYFPDKSLKGWFPILRRIFWSFPSWTSFLFCVSLTSASRKFRSAGHESDSSVHPGVTYPPDSTAFAEIPLPLAMTLYLLPLAFSPFGSFSARYIYFSSLSLPFWDSLKDQLLYLTLLLLFLTHLYSFLMLLFDLINFLLIFHIL